MSDTAHYNEKRQVHGSQQGVAAQPSLPHDELEATLSPNLRDKNGLWACNNCGFHPQNRSSWCALGCGSDYNRMINMKALILAQRQEAVKEALTKALGNPGEQIPFTGSMDNFSTGFAWA